MDPRFEPVFQNPHLLTMAGNFWPRDIDQLRFPAATKLYRTGEATTVQVLEHRPERQPRGHIVLLHGLEGSADSGYIRSFSQAALERGFAVHRKNFRTCGGTEELCETMYHSGLTSDTRFVLERLRERDGLPVLLVGFSLGGNVALKLAGELGETDLPAAVCAVSTPIDLAESVRALDGRWNRIYAQRFVRRLKERVARKSRLSPHLYSAGGIDRVRGIWEFDDRFTAPLFGFGTAENYYRTQSASRFLHLIRVPTLLVAAQDDPLVPFSMYRDCAAIRENPNLKLLAPEHGGHLGFLSRKKPRFWIDGTLLSWIEGQLSRLDLRRTCRPSDARRMNA